MLWQASHFLLLVNDGMMIALCSHIPRRVLSGAQACTRLPLVCSKPATRVQGRIHIYTYQRLNHAIAWLNPAPKTLILKCKPHSCSKPHHSPPSRHVSSRDCHPEGGATIKPDTRTATTPDTRTAIVPNPTTDLLFTTPCLRNAQHPPIQQ